MKWRWDEQEPKTGRIQLFMDNVNLFLVAVQNPVGGWKEGPSPPIGRCFRQDTGTLHVGPVRPRPTLTVESASDCPTA